MPFSWKQNTWCGKHIPLSCPLPYSGQVFLYTVIAPKCIISSYQTNLVLKRCLNVAAKFCHRYIGDDSLFRAIIQRWISSCATGVRCKSRLNADGKNSLTAYVQQTCLQNATAIQGGCQAVDISCLCSSANYINSLGCCLSKNCDQADQTCTSTPRETALMIR